MAPAYRADAVVTDDLRDSRAHLVLKDGRVVAREGGLAADLPARPIAPDNTVRLPPLDESSVGRAAAAVPRRLTAP